jgi:methylmalonyl-CoA mutase
MSEQKQSGLLAEFSPISTAEWEDAIRRDLKGQDYAKRLVWQTDDGIAVKPYYRREDLEGLDSLDLAPGDFPYTRGAARSNDWRIREEIEERDVTAANAAARAALDSGADEILFRHAVPTSGAELSLLLKGLETAEIHFDAGPDAPALLALIARHKPDLRGSLGFNPSSDLDAAAAMVRDAPEQIKPVVIGGAAFHESGGTTVQEIGFTVAAGIDYINQMSARGVDPEKSSRAVAFSLAIGRSYFFQIAKLRAFRKLWARAVDAFGCSKDAAKAAIYARTAQWDKSIYDSHVNILRSTTEAMSAAMGGCDSLAVAPFDETYRTADGFSRRLARNTQLILKREAWLDQVADPAGGAYFVEALTESIAREAWKLMQHVESIGGFRKAEHSGMIPGALAESRQKKEAAIAARRAVFIGTNQYPNLAERMLERVQRVEHERFGRGPEIFEDIRLRTERHAAVGGKTPLFLLAEMGDLTMRKARSGFIANFFGCAGFEIRAQHFEDAAALSKTALEAGADVVVLCSSDEEYPNLANAVIQAVKGIPVIIAGRPKEAVEQLKSYGVADFVHIRSNAAETLAAWQDRLGVRG